MWRAAQDLWYGLSASSVLLLAAIGLAITFGVMGVINMAHVEMVMLGAYATYVVQLLLPSWLQNWSLAFAIPLAFVVAATVGVARRAHDGRRGDNNKNVSKRASAVTPDRA